MFSNFEVKTSTLLIAMALGLSACGGGGEQQKAKAPEQKPATQAPVSTELAEKQEIVIDNGAEPESLDPHKVSGVPESHILAQMFEGLTSTDKDGNTIAGIAQKWESSDNKVWLFHLRDAKWSNGDPITADDFVYSFRRLTDPATASPYSSYLVDAHVKNAKDVMEGKAKPDSLGVKAIDPKTLEITLDEPIPYFPDTLGHTSVLPVHQKTIEQFKEKWTDPKNIVVNGAFKLKDWQVNNHIILERNATYYDDASNKINLVTFLPITSAVASLNRYKAGETDLGGEFPSEQFEEVKKEFGDQLKMSPILCTYYYEFNVKKAPFDDVKVRTALSMTLDRDTITHKVTKLGQPSAYQLTPLSTQGVGKFEPEWQAWDMAKRTAEAKKLLNEAGYNEQNPLKFELLYNTSETHKKIAVAAASFWKDKLGFVEVSLANQEWKTYLDTRRNGKFQVSRAGWCADYNEASTFLNILKSDNAQNHGQYKNEKFDALMLQTVSPDTTPEKRAQLYTEAEAVISQDMPLLPVYHYLSARLIKPHVQGYSTQDPTGHWHVKNFSILKH